VEKIELIKMAVKEWGEHKLSSYQAMMNIAVVLAIEKPSSGCIEWAKKAAVQMDCEDRCGNIGLSCYSNYKNCPLDIIHKTVRQKGK